MNALDWPPFRPAASVAANGAAPASNGDVAEIRRVLLEEAQDTRTGGDVVREAVPGTGGLIYRGISHFFFGERGSGKSTVALAVAVSASAAGEKVLYLDRENGPALTRVRIADLVDANDWPDPLEGGQLVGRHYPEIHGAWTGAAVAEAIAGLGFTGVVYDSVREVMTQLGGNPNDDADYSRLVNMLVTPLLQRGVWVVLLDNVGHIEKGRPKGAGAKLDATPAGYLVETDVPFSPGARGRITVTCKRSRYGDMDCKWTMAVGDGAFAVPALVGEAPDAERARKMAEAVAAFRTAVQEVLRDEHPLGRDRLLAAVRKKGVKGRNEKLQDWLRFVSDDPTSGVVATGSGYDLATLTLDSGSGSGHGGSGTPDPPPPYPKGGAGEAALTRADGPGDTDEPSAEDIAEARQQWHEAGEAS